MGLKVFLTGAVLALAGGASAQSLDPVRVEMFRSILAGNECTLTEAAAQNILPRFDFTREETRSIVGALVAAGEVQLDGNTLMLVDGSCASEDPVVDLLGQRDVQQFIAIMSEHSCSMDEKDAEPIFTERGMNKAQIRAVVGPMLDANMVTFDGGVLTVDSAYCSAPVVEEDTPEERPVQIEPDLVEPGVDMAMVATLRQIFAENGCRLDNDQMAALLPPAGFTRNNVQPIFDYLGGAGELQNEDGVMILTGDICDAAPADQPAQADSGAPGVDMAMVATLRQIFAENGCRLDNDQMDALLPPAGFTHENARPIFNFLEEIGELTDADGAMVMTGENCASAPVEAPVATQPAFEDDGSPQARFVAAVIENGCALEIFNAESYLADNADLRLDQAFRIVDDMVAGGDATLNSDGTIVQLDPALCADTGTAPVVEEANPAEAPEEAAPAPVETTSPEANSDDPRAGLLAMLAANNCEITQNNAADMIAAAGLDFNTSIQMLTQMMGSGEATSPDGGQTLQVGAPLCVATAAEPMTPRDIFINLIKQNNCSITAAEFGTMLPVDGLDANTAFGMISDLEAEGVISLPATRDVVTLSAEMCR